MLTHRVESQNIRRLSNGRGRSVTCQNDFESEVFAVPLLPRRRLPRSRIRPVDFSDTGAEDDAEASHAKNAEFLRANKKLIRFSERAFLPRI